MVLFAVGFVLVLLVLNVMLWKSGFVGDAEKPECLIDRPVIDAKERKAFMKRLRRWKDEGKLSRIEFEAVYRLCQAEWDVPSP